MSNYYTGMQFAQARNMDSHAGFLSPFLQHPVLILTPVESFFFSFYCHIHNSVPHFLLRLSQ